jgi:hypothetical protein
MADRYRISTSSETNEEAPSESGEQSLLRPVLWIVLFLSAAANAAMSSIGANPLAGAGFGLITLACAVTLVVHHYRNRSAKSE